VISPEGLQKEAFEESLPGTEPMEVNPMFKNKNFFWTTFIVLTLLNLQHLVST